MWPEGITCLKELTSEWSRPSVSILSSSLFSGPIKATDHCALLAFCVSGKHSAFVVHAWRPLHKGDMERFTGSY